MKYHGIIHLCGSFIQHVELTVLLDGTVPSKGRFTQKLLLSRVKLILWFIPILLEIFLASNIVNVYVFLIIFSLLDSVRGFFHSSHYFKRAANYHNLEWWMNQQCCLMVSLMIEVYKNIYISLLSQFYILELLLISSEYRWTRIKIIQVIVLYR